MLGMASHATPCVDACQEFLGLYDRAGAGFHATFPGTRPELDSLGPLSPLLLGRRHEEAEARSASGFPWISDFTTFLGFYDLSNILVRFRATS